MMQQRKTTASDEDMYERLRKLSLNDDVAAPDYEERYRNDPNMRFVGRRATAGTAYFVGRCGRSYFHIPKKSTA